jgi:hypothetical protein
MTEVKSEYDFSADELDIHDEPERVLEPEENEVPAGFEREEWDVLTGVIITKINNVQCLLLIGLRF